MKKLILLVIAILLCFSAPVLADNGEVKDLMDLLNLDWALFLQLSTAVAIITEAFKRRLSKIFVGGWKTPATLPSSHY